MSSNSSTSDNKQRPAWMVWWRPFIVLIAVGVLSLALAYGYTTWQFIEEPLTVSELKIDRSPIRYGESIVFSAKYNRKKLCLVTSDYFIFEDPGMVLVKRERLPAGMARIMGSKDADEVIRVPIPTAGYQPLSPGNYLIRIFIHSDCGYRLYTVELPDVEFEIVE